MAALDNAVSLIMLFVDGNGTEYEGKEAEIMT